MPLAKAAFDAISSSLNSSPADRADAIKKVNAIFCFTLKNDAGETESWYIDLKKKGEVGKGTAPEGGKADDADFASLIAGKANAQKLFMGGKLKIRGDVMKATRMEPVLKRAQTGAKL